MRWSVINSVPCSLINYIFSNQNGPEMQQSYVSIIFFELRLTSDKKLSQTVPSKLICTIFKPHNNHFVLLVHILYSTGLKQSEIRSEKVFLFLLQNLLWLLSILKSLFASCSRLYSAPLFSTNTS